MQDNIVWEPHVSYVDGVWRGGWLLSQEAADKRLQEYLEKEVNAQGKPGGTK